MSCEPRPSRRLSDRIVLAVTGLLAVFYLAVSVLIVSPEVDESYRRTYITGEFSILPNADSFGAADGLSYSPGRRVSLRLDDGRKHLARFDWDRDGQPLPTLDATSGRLFLHLTGIAESSPHRLRLALVCRLPVPDVATIDVAVDGRPVGSIDCGHGRIEADFAVPAGVFGRLRYDEITLTRHSNGILDRIATDLALDHDAIGLESFAIDVVDTGPIAMEKTKAPSATAPE